MNNHKFEYSIICCPYCGHEYTHQRTVEVFQREEDEKEGLHVIINRNKTVNISRKGNTNHNSRRQWTVIALWCEACDKTLKLNIMQHKGQTFLYFEQAENRCIKPTIK